MGSRFCAISAPLIRSGRLLIFVMQSTRDSSKDLDSWSLRTFSLQARVTETCAAFTTLDGTYRSRPSVTMLGPLKAWSDVNTPSAVIGSKRQTPAAISVAETIRRV